MSSSRPPALPWRWRREARALVEEAFDGRRWEALAESLGAEAEPDTHQQIADAPPSRTGVPGSWRTVEPLPGRRAPWELLRSHVGRSVLGPVAVTVIVVGGLAAAEPLDPLFQAAVLAGTGYERPVPEATGVHTASPTPTATQATTATPATPATPATECPAVPFFARGRAPGTPVGPTTGPTPSSGPSPSPSIAAVAAGRTPGCSRTR